VSQAVPPERPTDWAGIAAVITAIAGLVTAISGLVLGILGRKPEAA